MSDKVQTTCSHCGQTYQFAAAQLERSIGRSVTCRKCGQMFTIARPAGVGVLAAAVGADLASAPASGGTTVAASAPPPPVPSAAESAVPTTAGIPGINVHSTIDYVRGVAQAVGKRVHDARAPHDADPVPPPPGGNGHAIDYATPSPRHDTGDRLIFEGGMTPQIDLLPGERVIERFDANVWDLGFIGRLLGHKRRLVVTSHRVFQFQKKVIENRLDILWLARVTSAAVGQTVELPRFVIGVMIGGYGVVNLLSGLFQSLFGRLGGASGSLLLAIVLMGIGGLLILTARTKTMLVSAHGDRVAIKLTRLRPEESRRFVDAIFHTLHQPPPAMDGGPKSA